MVPVPSQCFVRWQAADRGARCRDHRGPGDRTRNGGAEIVGLLKTGSAYYAPSSAAAKMVRGGALRLAASRCRSAPGPTASTGSQASTWASRPRSAPAGSTGIVELDLTEDEMADLRAAAEAVRAKVDELDGIDLG